MAYSRNYQRGSPLSDAILGLRELLEIHPHLILAHLTPLITGCVRLIGDEASDLQKYCSIRIYPSSRMRMSEKLSYPSSLGCFATSPEYVAFPICLEGQSSYRGTG